MAKMIADFFRANIGRKRPHILNDMPHNNTTEDILVDYFDLPGNVVCLNEYRTGKEHEDRVQLFLDEFCRTSIMDSLYIPPPPVSGNVIPLFTRHHPPAFIIADTSRFISPGEISLMLKELNKH